MNLLIAESAQAQQVAILLLRLFIGPCLIVHGLGKLGIVGPGGPNALQGFTNWLESLGVP
ncbi:DoxX family membrane protein, partial [bacterium]|nr:DoxX family membrane protein [bacterium]